MTGEQERTEYRFAEKSFNTREQAIQFIVEFWTAIDPNQGKQAEEYMQQNGAREWTFGDRTVLEEEVNLDGGKTFKVMIHPNSSARPLMPKAVDFLKSKGILN